MNNNILAVALLACLASTGASAGQPGGSLSAAVADDAGGQPTALPLGKTFAQLSEDERALLRDQYELLRDSDEPPFPAQGLDGIVGELAVVQARAGLKGEMYAVVAVDARGQAQSVSYLRPLPAEVQDEVREILLRAPFKPARCGAKACKMEFPLRVDFGSGSL
jgi:hypothetical protein